MTASTSTSDILQGDSYRVVNDDCIRHMATLPPACFDLAVFSPPFPSVYAYTSLESDLGNSEGLKTDAKLHFGFFFKSIVRVMKPGRVMMVHCTQIPRMKRAGGTGLFDFRGLLIRLGERAGFTFEYDWLVRRNPQAQAIRTRSRELQFAGLESDRCRQRGALGDYLLKFTAPGDNECPIDDRGEVSRNEWIDWAEACWSDIKETDTLNVSGTKGEGDTRHICPLQLGIIERLVRLYSSRGEVVFDPFSGIGSTGYISLLRGRRYYGIELKDEYHQISLRNLERAVRTRTESSRTLFDEVDVSDPVR